MLHSFLFRIYYAWQVLVFSKVPTPESASSISWWKKMHPTSECSWTDENRMESGMHSLLVSLMGVHMQASKSVHQVSSERHLYLYHCLTGIDLTPISCFTGRWRPAAPKFNMVRLAVPARFLQRRTMGPRFHPAIKTDLLVFLTTASSHSQQHLCINKWTHTQTRWMQSWSRCLLAVCNHGGSSLMHGL